MQTLNSNDTYPLSIHSTLVAAVLEGEGVNRGIAGYDLLFRGGHKHSPGWRRRQQLVVRRILVELGIIETALERAA